MRSAFAAVLLVAVNAVAQTPKSETVTLDAREKTIVEASYHDDRAIAVSGREAGGWHLYAGAAIDARRINLTMRNVVGVVRFRADSGRLAALIDRSRRRQNQQP